MLRILQSSTYEFILSSPPLAKVLFINLTRRIYATIHILLFFVTLPTIFLGLKYYHLKQKSNRGYLYEMTCEKINRDVVCNYNQTDVYGMQKKVFSSRIKSASSAVISYDYYFSCSLSLVRTDGKLIKNVGIFAKAERSKDCPETRKIVKQINTFILAKDSKPIVWRKDSRVGDLTQEWITNSTNDSLLPIFYITGVTFSLVSLLIILFSRQEYWRFNTRSGSVFYRYASLYSIVRDAGDKEIQFFINQVKELSFDSMSIEIKWKDKNLERLRSNTLCFEDKDDKLKTLFFLEDITGLKATEIPDTVGD